ncbi:hypothetical protein K440DRAFT_645305 [Wilcoxina mikolae CBS 423.85]|nr:hypothetical protein K440DRAFT_645305 [Wilcoxina mikolae CBS 423.85]
MTELSLALAIVGLVPPSLHSYRNCLRFYHNIRTQRDDFNAAHTVFKVHKALFEMECRHILGNILGQDDATHMLADIESGRDWTPWVERLSEKSRLKATLGSVVDAQRALLEVTRKELEKVEKQLEKCVPNSVTSKASWALSRKEDINLSLKFLGDRNKELRKLRTEQVHLIQIPPNEEKGKVKDTQRIEIQSEGLRESSDLSPSNISGFQVPRVRRFARQLQRNLWPTICNCHHYDLKLLETANDDLEDHSVPVNFSFVVTDTAPTYLVRTGYLIKTSATQESQTTTIITDLCPRTSPRSRSRKSKTDFMGILKDSHQKYTNSVHNDSISTRRLSRISLSDRLSRCDTSNILLPRDRAELALQLASAVLQYGSFDGCWFQDFWSSRDVFFFIDESPEIAGSPHISTLKPQKKNGNISLVSLAVVMAEVGLVTAFGSFTDKWEMARKIEGELKRLKRRMGKTFADAVATCLCSDFWPGLDKKDVRLSFNEKIVGRLQRIVQHFVDEDLKQREAEKSYFMME